MQTLTLTDLAALLHMTPRSVQNRMYRDPESLPTPLQIPGKKTLWSKEEVVKWLKSPAQ